MRVYFAKDNDTGNVSPLRETRVYKAISSNSAPDAFDLVSPADGTEVLTTFILDWEDTTDPDGDSFTYTVLLSADDALFSDPIKKEGLKYSSCLMDPGDGIEDLTDHFLEGEGDRYIRSHKGDGGIAICNQQHQSHGGLDRGLCL